MTEPIDIRFTIVNPEAEDKFYPLCITQVDDEVFTIKLYCKNKDLPVKISSQQLGELGALFTKIAGEIDTDSVNELLEGLFGE